MFEGRDTVCRRRPVLFPACLPSRQSNKISLNRSNGFPGSAGISERLCRAGVLPSLDDERHVHQPKADLINLRRRCGNWVKPVSGRRRRSRGRLSRNFRNLQNKAITRRCYRPPAAPASRSPAFVTFFFSFPLPSGDKDGSKVTTVVATPGQGPDRPQEVSYTDTKVIGNGSFGVVYQAKLCDSGELVAIKKVLQDKRFKVRHPPPQRAAAGSDGGICALKSRRCASSHTGGLQM